MCACKSSENANLAGSNKNEPVTCAKQKIKKIIPFSNEMETKEDPKTKANCSDRKHRTYSRKREASSSFSEDLKRYKDKMLLTSELIQKNVFSHSLSSSSKNEANLNNFKLSGSDINMNSFWPQDNAVRSLHQDIAILQNMEIDFRLGVKSDPCLDNSPFASNSDLSVHSASTSVGIQEDLDCLHLSDEITSSEMSGDLDYGILMSPLTSSLFHRVPPTIYFSSADEKIQPFPCEIQKLLKWKTSTITPVLIRDAVEKSGFQIIKDGDWLGVWGKHLKCAAYHNIADYQKVNHFPGSFHLGRKDKMWQNYNKMCLKHGTEFSFFPETFIIPQDLRILRKVWETDGPKRRWIIKPPASARGTGIKVINRWNQIPKTHPVIVQRYLSEPYLINDSKFDLRLYVLVPSYDPLRIYIFEDGLVRFASVKYSTSVHSLSDSFMHLTNYSINKKSSTYTTSEDESTCRGHKWTLKSLEEYLENKGVGFSKIWEDTLDLVIKTIICSESPMTHLIRNFAKCRYNCFELFGFDIMLDKYLKPWLLEVNISPSLHINSSLDFRVKSQLVKDMLNLVGYRIPYGVCTDINLESFMAENGISLEATDNLCMNMTLHSWYLSPDEKMKHTHFTQKLNLTDENILDKLTPDDVRQLVESEDELSRSGSFHRIFPSQISSKYLKFFERCRYYNLLLDAWEGKYCENRNEGIALLQSLCQKNYHLQTLFKEQPSTVKEDEGADV